MKLWKYSCEYLDLYVYAIVYISGLLCIADIMHCSLINKNAYVSL